MSSQNHSSPSAHAKEYVELHDQVNTSLNLLDSLESFLSTFQKDLSAVSGQISDLQDRSKHIENRLKSRRKIEKPLSTLISDITIPPPLATEILDSQVSEAWVPLLEDFEQRLQTSKARARVKAARDLKDVFEGLRIVAVTKLRAFFIALFTPIRTSVTTNMQVLQSSVVMKHRPLFSFLQRQAPSVALELQRSYIGAARTYYETGFRRYIRSLGWIKARSVERPESFVSETTSRDITLDSDRLEYAKLSGKAVTLAFMGDNKSHQEPLEALFRSFMLVLMDNATAEYIFISQFFTPSPPPPSATESLPFSPGVPSSSSRKSSIVDPTGDASFADLAPPGAAEAGAFPSALTKEERVVVDGMWRQVMDPVLEYTKTFLKTVIEPPPPVVSLLTMIRLTEAVVAEVQKRGTGPLETFIFSLRLSMWPVFQKAITTHVEEVQNLADGATGGYFTKAIVITESTVSQISKRYVAYFHAFVALTGESEETVIFSNLLRLRQGFIKVIDRYTSKTTNPAAQAAAQVSIYGSVLQALSSEPNHTAHPKFQEEVAFWSRLEEEVKRKLSARAR